MTRLEIEARIEALEEAARHLRLHWTEVAEERRQALLLADRWEQEAIRLESRLGKTAEGGRHP